MLLSDEFRLRRIRTCICDLSENGIDLVGSDDRRLTCFVRDNLDYFQLMLGGDSNMTEIVALLRQRIRHAGSN